MTASSPSAEQALAEAGELSVVCRPRELSTIEIFEPNAFYGNDRVLKLYAGLPPDRSLKVVVPHGVVFNDSYLWEAERRALLPAVLAYSDERAQAYARATGKYPMRSAVPFAYVAKLLPPAPAAERRGTLFFPSHSTHRITALADYAGMADMLAAMEERYRPVTVCIYWRDYELGRQLPFLHRGLRVVSAGHIFDPDFLFRLFHLLSRHRYAASNVPGSNLLYAVIAGCSYFLVPGFDVTHQGSNAALANDLSHGGRVLASLRQAYAYPPEETNSGRWDLVARLSGLDNLHAPEELRSLLEMADRLDRIGLARHPRSRELRASFPRAYPRAALRLALKGKRALWND